MARVVYATIAIYGILGLFATIAFGSDDSDLLNYRLTQHNVQKQLCRAETDVNKHVLLHLVCSGMMRIENARYIYKFSPFIYSKLKHDYGVK